MNFCVLSTKFLMLLIFNFIQLQKSCYANDEKYEECKRPYKCGNVSLSYPFYDAVNRPLHCGYPGFHIECNNAIPKISMLSDIYYLVSLDDAASHTFYVAKQIYWDNSCLKNMSNTSINFTLYRYTLLDENITIFYDCPRANIMSANEYYCGNTSINSTKYYFITHSSESSHSQAADICHSRILVPIVKSLYWSITNLVNLTEVFRYAFQLEWLAENYLCDGCLGSGGECGYDTNMSRFTCYCPDRPYDSKCSSGSTSHKHKIYRIAGVILACIAIGIGMLALLACYFKKRYSTDNQDINAFLKKYGPLATKRYTYRSLKKIANSFNDKLGEGGYGIVYKGKLPNGRLVAVKLLKESKGNAEEFINEVSSIGKTNHVNVVTLLGFCFEGQRRALVYDFMPNGSLEKFIYGKKKNNKSLAWDELFQIAVGIARGLDYLHRGCNTRIVHFDIKPHNILLDENFCPKISDFGLAKPFQQNNSIISMSGARGTVGFIAPEVFISSFGGVSHKSDVYSYGMLVLDMVGRRQNENAEVEHSSEQYFPQWIYKELEQTEEFDQQDILNGEEKETLRKMILVSLWCIQTNPSRRPPMTRVVEMLEGPLESLQIPPTPYLFPLPISHLTSSSTATFPI